MYVAQARSRDVFNQLQPGDRVQIAHAVTVGQKQWTTFVEGEVVSKERRRHGLHFRRNLDDKVYSDLLVLRRSDGELTTVTIDEYTDLRRLN